MPGQDHAQGSRTGQENVKTRILETSPYVGFMTGTPSTAEAAIVKDCTRPRFCLKELPHRERLTTARPMISTGFQTSAPAGRMNARTADRAGAWFQEMDRLEAAWGRGQPPHHCLCDHDPGAHAEGRRHRRYLDRADRHTAGPYRARGAVRGVRVLHPHLL